MKRYATAALFLVLVGCLKADPVTPTPTEDRIAEWTFTCTTLWREELDRDIDAAALEGCLNQIRGGATAEQIRVNLHQSEEYRLRLERLERERREQEERGRFRGRLRVDGHRFIDGQGVEFVPMFASTLAILGMGDIVALFDQIKASGANGVRVFAGRLTWANLSPGQSLDRLAKVLQMARDRGLYVLVTVLTDTRDWGASERTHLEAMVNLTTGWDNVLLEVANEPYHPTQSSLVNDYTALCGLARPLLASYPNPWALGSAPEDAPINGRYMGDCGTFNTTHLRRSTNHDEMITALGGLKAIMSITGKPVINSEPIGAAETSRPGSRTDNVEFFRRLAHRSNSYGFGAVFHSEDGLYGRVLGPRQLEALNAFIEGFRLPREDVPAPRDETPCASVTDPEAIVRCERNRYQGQMSTDQIVDLLKAVVRRLNQLPRDGDYGILVKPSGNNCSGYSCDVVCMGQAEHQRQWDVLGDVGGTNTPGWHELARLRRPTTPRRATTITVRPCEVVR